MFFRVLEKFHAPLFPFPQVGHAGDNALGRDRPESANAVQVLVDRVAVCLESIVDSVVEQSGFSDAGRADQHNGRWFFLAEQYSNLPAVRLSWHAFGQRTLRCSFCLVDSEGCQHAKSLSFRFLVTPRMGNELVPRCFLVGGLSRIDRGGALNAMDLSLSFPSVLSASICSSVTSIHTLEKKVLAASSRGFASSQENHSSCRRGW